VPIDRISQQEYRFCSRKLPLHELKRLHRHPCVGRRNVRKKWLFTNSALEELLVSLGHKLRPNTIDQFSELSREYDFVTGLYDGLSQSLKGVARTGIRRLILEQYVEDIHLLYSASHPDFRAAGQIVAKPGGSSLLGTYSENKRLVVQRSHL
jgi:hypothetical protein